MTSEVDESQGVQIAPLRRDWPAVLNELVNAAKEVSESTGDPQTRRVADADMVDFKAILGRTQEAE